MIKTHIHIKDLEWILSVNACQFHSIPDDCARNDLAKTRMENSTNHSQNVILWPESIAKNASSLNCYISRDTVYFKKHGCAVQAQRFAYHMRQQKADKGILKPPRPDLNQTTCWM